MSAVSAALPTARPSVGSHQPVGEAFRVVLHPRVADRRAVDKLGDLAGGGVGADARGADGDLAFAQHGGGEHHLAGGRGQPAGPRR